MNTILNNISKYNNGYFLKSFLYFEKEKSLDQSITYSKKINDKIKFLIKDYKKKEKISVIWSNSNYSSDLYKITQKYTHNIFDSLVFHTPEEIVSRLVWMAFILENPNLEERIKYFRFDSFSNNGITFVIDDFKKELNQFPKNANIITLPFRKINAAYLNLNAVVPDQLQNPRNLKSLMNYINNNFKSIKDMFNDDKTNLEKHEKYIEVYNVKYLINEDVPKEKLSEIETSASIYNHFLSEFGLDPKNKTVCWTRSNLQYAIDDNKNDEAKFRKIFASYKNLNMFLKDFI